MKASSSRFSLNRQILDEAAAWFVDFRVGDIDAHARKEFNTWLRRSPEHIQAYLDIARTYASLAAASPTGEIDVTALVAETRSTIDSNVVPLSAPQERQERAAAPHAATGRSRAWISLAASLLMVVIGAWLYIERETYSTAIGEQRSITLADGSTVELNAQSRIRLRFSDSERGVELLQGQALFQIAKDSRRPFVVRSAGTQVRAVGTQFDVYRKRTGTTVTVLEGRVAVTGGKELAGSVAADRAAAPMPSTADPLDSVVTDDATIYLAAGEQLTVTPVAISTPKHANVAAATAWTQRRFVFERATLADVAEEFNRYNTRPLIIDETAPRDFHVSGTYSSSNPGSLLRFLQAQDGIRVIETQHDIHVSGP